jgi:hypothetical protein
MKYLSLNTSLARFFCFCFFLIGSSFSLSAQPDAVQMARELLDDSMAKLQTEHEENLQDLRHKYANALDQLGEGAKAQGDLDRFLLIEAVKKRLSAGENIGSEDGWPEALNQVQQVYLENRHKLEEEWFQKRSRLWDGYVLYLQNMQKNFVQSGDIEAAVTCRDEINRITALKAEVAPEKPVQLADPVPQPEPNGVVSLMWHPRKHNNKPVLFAGGKQTILDISSEKGHRHSLRGVECREVGQTWIKGGEKELAQAIINSGELTLVIGLETNSMKQDGPARIFTFSNGTAQRNFTIGQENEKLVLRLRTTETGDNGSNPEIQLGELINGKYIQLVYTYHPEHGGTLYLGGKNMAVKQVGGKLENWKDDMQILIGNESTGDRPWLGTVGRFEVHSKAIDSEMAKKWSVTR